jgi:hypothetical protein
MKKIILSVLCLLFCVCMNAQQDWVNNGNLYIHTGTSVTGFGSLTNSSGAALTNNGSLYVRRDITNNQASMTTATGTLYFNGSSTQSLNGSQIFKTYNLVTNNNAGIALNNNLSVTALHTFSAGLIATSATPNYLVYEAGSSYTGDNDSRHVTGWIKKLGNTNFVFPVGNAMYERTVALTNLTAVSEFDARYYNSPTPNKNNLFSPVVLIDTNEYWRINKISGSNARVVINWDNAKIPVPQISIPSVKAGYYNGSFWTNISAAGSATGTVATTGTVTSNSVSAFNNNFTIASTSWVLPLDIISFAGSCLGNYNRLNWSVANEVNVDHYELQRSDDGIGFTTINSQYAKNNTIALYTYDDVTAMQNKVYYRLRCVDVNGQEKYSGIVIISAAQGIRKDFYVIKNPVKDRIEIYAGNTVKGNYMYNFTNAAGQMVQSGTLDIKYEGIETIKLQTLLPAGVYMLLVYNAGNTLQKSILIE